MFAEFLAKLPLKASVRFRCVNKHWFNMLLDSKFFESYLTRLSQGLLVQQLRYEEYSSFTVRDMYFIEHQDSCDVSVTKIGEKVQLPYFKPNLVTSCNGLVCLYENEKGVFHVSNPLTKESIIFGVVRSEENLLTKEFSRYYKPHSFDPVIGFGVCNGSNQYKVLKTWKNGIQNCEDIIFLTDVGAEIYTVGDPNPRKIHSIYLGRIDDSPGVFLNGILHWLDISGSFIIRFDLQSEKFSEGFLPPNVGYWLNLGVSRGYLYVCQNLNNSVHPDIAIWKMGEYGKAESWVRTTMINNSLEMWTSIDTDIEIIKISEDWTKVLLLCDMQLFWYNSADRSFNKAETSGLEYICHAIPYVPSFISPLDVAGFNEDVGNEELPEIQGSS
ncbi:hypothetical protein ACFE04_029114 [Oxalis oulophora]